jgi:hypothetical protein
MAFFSRRAFYVLGHGMGLGREVSHALGPRSDGYATFQLDENRRLCEKEP